MKNADESPLDGDTPKPQVAKTDTLSIIASAGLNQSPLGRGIPAWVGGAVVFALFLAVNLLVAGKKGEWKAQQVINRTNEHERRAREKQEINNWAAKQHKQHQDQVWQTMNEFDAWRKKGGRDYTQFLTQKQLKQPKGSR